MKKYLSVSAAAVAACCMVVGGSSALKAQAEEKLACKAAYLCDFESGTKVYSENEEKRLPIASMCKIMTLLLSFEAVESGELMNKLRSVRTRQAWAARRFFLIPD